MVALIKLRRGVGTTSFCSWRGESLFIQHRAMSGQTKTKKAAAAGGKVKKASVKPTHPSCEKMVMMAVTALEERKGSSLAAIKKYIASTYKVDTVKKALFIRKALQKAVAAGSFVQVKSSFKLAVPVVKKKTTATAAGSGKPRGRPKKTVEAKAPKKKAIAPKKKKATTPKKKKKSTTPKKTTKAAASSAKKPKPKSTSAKKLGRPKKN